MPQRPGSYRIAVPRPAEERPTAARRGYDRDWQAARLGFLADHPCCRRCGERGRVAEATVVDHVVPHRGDPVLFWDRANWQPLCKPCHDRKTAAEDRVRPSAETAPGA